MKGPWEERVGLLVQPPNFVYSYKPVDSKFHGGAVRMDRLAADRLGLFWMIEVKQLPENALSININSEVSVLQQAALSELADSMWGVPVLAVGQGDMLYIWGWRYVQWLRRYQEAQGSPKPHLLPLHTAMWVLHWTGKTKWVDQYELYEIMVNPDGEPQDRSLHSVQTATVLSPLLPRAGVSILILKRRDYILIHGRMQPLERSSSRQGVKDLSSGNTPNGGMKSSPTKTRKRLARTSRST